MTMKPSSDSTPSSSTPVASTPSDRAAETADAITDAVTDAVPPANTATKARNPLPHFVFCRGCAASIHETAITCPRCGAPQVVMNTPGLSGGGSSRDSSSPQSQATWQSVVSGVLGGFMLLLVLVNDSWERDELSGGVMLSGFALALAVLGPRTGGRLTALSWVGAICGGIAGLLYLGRLAS